MMNLKAHGILFGASKCQEEDFYFLSIAFQHSLYYLRGIK